MKMIKNEVIENLNTRYNERFKIAIDDRVNLLFDCVKTLKYPIERANQLEKNNLDSLATFLYDEALYNLFIEKDINKTKQSFYLSAKMSYYEQCFFKKNKSFFVTSLYHNTAMLLSDNIDLIKKYSTLTYNTYEEDLKNGHAMPFIQAFIRDDIEYIKQRLKYHKIHLKEKYWFNFTDIDFFEALLNGDKKKMEESIIILATKQHKKRNDGIYRKDLISTPALTYAKLAYIKGYKLDIDHPLIPRELLPVKPNDEYWEYDFMKEGKYKDV